MRLLRVVFYMLLLLFFSHGVFGADADTESGVKRITLQKTDVIGSQELPRVVSIMSWKKTKPMDQPLLHKKLEMLFESIDEKEFSREVFYRQQMSVH